jgi:hypothetical protein
MWVLEKTVNSLDEVGFQAVLGFRLEEQQTWFEPLLKKENFN